MPSVASQITVLLEDRPGRKRSNLERRRILLDKINKRTIPEAMKSMDDVALIREDRDR